MQTWQPGARAAIVISEHFENMNRIVTLIQPFEFNNGVRGWSVEDGRLFKGYNSQKFPARVLTHDSVLDIEQWKLRLLEDGDDVVIRDGIEYVNA